LVLLWGLGQEVELFNRISIADSLLARFLPEPEVEVRLLVARAALSHQASPQAKALADRIKTVQTAKEADKPSQAYQKALLEQALIADYHADPIGGDLTWHRKTIWLITGLILITTAAAALNHWELLLMGAAGAFLSRLWRAVRSTKAPVAYWSYWVTLMLAPVAGALAAFGGVLLIRLLQDANVLGDAAKSIDWDSPRTPATLAVAFLLGFSERLFDRLAGQAEKAIDPANAAPAAPDAPPTSPTAPPGDENSATETAVAAAASNPAPQAVEAQAKSQPETDQSQTGDS
jgi:hypothetical protein